MQQRNHGFSEKIAVFPKNIGENFFPATPNTLVTLTHPYPLVTFRLSLSFLAVDQYPT